MGQAKARKQAMGNGYGKPSKSNVDAASKWKPHTEPIGKSDKHHYILVHEEGRIETIVCKRDDLYEKYMVPNGLDGHHTLQTDMGNLVIYWPDSGSMDGSEVNHRFSNLIGAVCYGPCLLGQRTQHSDGLKENQYNSLLGSLQNAPATAMPSEAIEAVVDQNLGMLEMSESQWIEFPFDAFRKNIAASDKMWGYIRQIDKKYRNRYLNRLLAVRKIMRSALEKRKGDPMNIIMGYASEEVEETVNA